MSKKIIPKKTCFMFGEGSGNEKRLFYFFEKAPKFRQQYEKKWTLIFDYGNGGSARCIFDKCIRIINKRPFDLVLLFIDIDDLKNDFPDSFKEKKKELENECKQSQLNMHIIWQDENLEDELSRVMGKKIKKTRVKQTLDSNKVKISNSFLIKRIIYYFEKYS